jgi:hypothetical protein
MSGLDINGTRISDTDTGGLTASDTMLYVLHGKRGGCEGRDTVIVIGLRIGGGCRRRHHCVPRV